MKKGPVAAGKREDRAPALLKGINGHSRRIGEPVYSGGRGVLRGDD